MHHSSICSQCGFAHSSVTCVTDGAVVAWFDSQTEEFLAALPGYEDGLTPRHAWNEFFCSSPATETAAASSPAPVVAGQGENTTLDQFQRWLETMAHDARNAKWLVPSVYQSQAEHDFCCNAMVESCRHATALLMLFKLEQGA